MFVKLVRVGLVIGQGVFGSVLKLDISVWLRGILGELLDNGEGY